MTNPKLKLAIRLAIGASLVSTIWVPAMAEESGIVTEESNVATETNVVTEPGKKGETIERVEITGSRIKRIEIEGPSPVTTISRDAIEASGDVSVGDVLRTSTFNSFGSFRETSGSSALSQSTVGLRGLGSQRTLVLIDGRRIAGSPVLGGGSQNLNTIPMAAVERIEVLQDGASAIYGADAVGGVINIIMRKDFEGMEFNIGAGRPSQPGGDDNTASLVGGVSSEKGNVTYAFDYEKRDIIFDRDRPYSRVFPSTIGFPGSFRVRDFFGDGTNIPGPFQAFANCPNETFPDGTPRILKQKKKIKKANGDEVIVDETFCQFNTADFSVTQPETERFSGFVSGNYDINERTAFFARSIISRQETFGRFAPAPAIFPNLIDKANPNNPVPGQDLDVRFRMVPLGNRDTTQTNYQFDLVTGLKGTFSKYDWEVAVQRNQLEIKDRGRNFGLISEFERLVASGEFNPFNPDPAVADRIRHTTSQDSEMLYTGINAIINGDTPLQIQGRPVAFAAGTEFRKEQYEDISDAQSAAGNVFGSAGGSAQANRSVQSAFGELSVPVHEKVELSFALRYDNYSDIEDGKKASPKAAFRWAPSDTIVLRGSVAKGFRVPNLDDLNASPAQAFDQVKDRVKCKQQGIPDNLCKTEQIESQHLSNKDLKPENSLGYSAGVVWEPVKDLNMKADFYFIEVKDLIQPPDSQAMIDAELAGAAFPTGGGVDRDAGGTITLIRAPRFNSSKFNTKGVDLEGNYKYDTNKLGTWNFLAQLSYIFSFNEEVVVGSGKLVNTAGGVNGENRGQPKLRGNFTVGWVYGNHKANVDMNYIHSTKAVRNVTADNGAEFDGHVASWTTFNAQYGYDLPWKGTVTFGARNVLDRDPPLNPDVGFPNYDNQLYDAFGRVLYVRYKQKL